MGVVAGGGQWVVDFFTLARNIRIGVSQILILQIYQGAPPQLSQLNRQYFAGIFHAFKAEIQNDDRSISLIVNNPHMQCIQRSLHNNQVTDFLNNVIIYMYI